MSKTSSDSFKIAIDRLAQARDEARLGLHLLSMEGRTKWDELEAKALVLEQKLGEGAEHLSELHAESAQKVARAVREFVDLHINGTAPAGVSK